MTLGYAGLILGAVFAGFVYVIIAAAVKVAGVKWLDRLMPVVVIGPTVSIIGLSLAGNAVSDLIKGSVVNAEGAAVASPLITVLCGLAALLVDLRDGVHELLEVFDLHGDGCLCRCCHLLNMQKETGGRWFARRPLAVGCYLVFLWSAARNCHGVARVSGGLLQDIE